MVYFSVEQPSSSNLRGANKSPFPTNNTRGPENLVTTEYQGV